MKTIFMKLKSYVFFPIQPFPFPSTQLSVFLFRLGGVENGDISADSITEEVFNEYVKPPKDAIWNSKTQDVTGLYASHPSILNADPIETVWKR